MAKFLLGTCKCRCSTPTCSGVTFNAKGCFSLALTSSYGSTSISVWTNNTKAVFVASGTTDSAGTLALSNLSPQIISPATYYFEATHSSGRFTTASGAFTCGSTVNVLFSGRVGASYVCFGGCALPVKRTLTYNDADLGDVTLTYGNALTGWQGTGSYPYPGCTDGLRTCDAGTISIAVSFGGSSSFGYTTKTTNKGSGVDPYTCPVPTGVTSGVSVVSDTLVCPPSFLDTITFTRSWRCGGTVTGTVTE